MANDPLYPFHECPEFLLPFCRLPLHTGKATAGQHGDRSHPLWKLWEHSQRSRGESTDLGEFQAAMIMPAAADCVILLGSAGDYRLSREMGKVLRITGDSPDGPFVATCAQYSVRAV